MVPDVRVAFSIEIDMDIGTWWMSVGTLNGNLNFWVLWACNGGNPSLNAAGLLKVLAASTRVALANSIWF